MTFWNSRYATGARLIAVPGCPFPTFCTASIARTRTVSTALRSRSVHSNDVPLLDGLLTWFLSRGSALRRAYSGTVVRLPLLRFPNLSRLTSPDEDCRDLRR